MHLKESSGAKETSEKKRLRSLKEKKLAFKTKERILRDALKAVDTKPNNKIIFDNDVIQTSKENKKKETEKNKILFDSDEDLEINEDDFKIKPSFNDKLLTLQSTIGNDKRFVLNERFIESSNDEDEDKDSKEKKHSDDEKTDEKEWQLGILENVLGKPIIKPNNVEKLDKKRKAKMIRYDPTENNHREYELITSKPQTNKKKEKKIEEDPIPVPTSQGIFYSVSDTLSKSLQEEGQFSLLKSLGRDSLDEEHQLKHSHNETKNIEIKPGLNFDTTNPFKYDSSEDELQEDDNVSCLNRSNNGNGILDGTGNMDKLFFVTNDPRLLKCEEFFLKPSNIEVEFQKLRYSLKQAVRAKIRNNLRNNSQRNKKKVVQISKRKLRK